MVVIIPFLYYQSTKLFKHKYKLVVNKSTDTNIIIFMLAV